MKIYIQRRDGQLYVKQVVKQNLAGRLDPYRMMRTIKTVEDTRETLLIFCVGRMWWAIRLKEF